MKRVGDYVVISIKDLRSMRDIEESSQIGG